MEEELKPCPHCGAHKISTHCNKDAQGDKYMCSLVCETCHAEIHSDWHENGHEAKKEAIKRWNERFGDTKLLFKDEYGVHDFAEWYKQEIISNSWDKPYYSNFEIYEINKEAQELIQAAMAKPNDEGLKIIPWELEHSLLKHSESFRDRVLEKLNLKSHKEYYNEIRRALEELKNCPYCGWRSLTIDTLKSDKSDYSGIVTCHHCGASIKTLNTYDTAQEAKELAAFQRNKRSIKKGE